MTAKQRRDLIRAMHLAAAIPFGLLAYAPVEIALEARPWVQWLVAPSLALSGLWMWKGHLLRRSPRAAQRS